MLIKETNRAHQIELQDAHDHADMKMKVDAQAHDTIVKTQTQLEIEAIMQLLLHHMDTGRLNQEIERRNAEQLVAINVAAQDIDNGQNPLMGM